MDFHNFECIVKHIFYIFLLFIFFALSASFWFLFDTFLFWKYTPLSEWSPLGRVLWITFSILTTIFIHIFLQKKIVSYTDRKKGS